MGWVTGFGLCAWQRTMSLYNNRHPPPGLSAFTEIHSYCDCSEHIEKQASRHIPKAKRRSVKKKTDNPCNTGSRWSSWRRENCTSDLLICPVQAHCSVGAAKILRFWPMLCEITTRVLKNISIYKRWYKYEEGIWCSLTDVVKSSCVLFSPLAPVFPADSQHPATY